MALQPSLISGMTCAWILLHLVVIAAGTENEGLSRVFVHVHHERSTDSELFARVDAFGSSHDLTLKKFKMPSVEVHRIDFGRNEEPIVVDVTDDIEETDFFIDERKGSLLYRNSDNTLEGAVTESFGIRFVNGQHVAARMRKVNTEFCDVRTASEIPTEFVSSDPKPATRASVSYTVEISLVVDSVLYQKFDSATSLVNYLKVYWYLVNRRFKSVNCATINIALKKIHYSTSSSEDSQFMDVSSSTTSDMSATLNKMLAYFSDSSRAPFDIAHLMSGRDFFRMQGGSPYYGVAGSAYVGAACVVYKDKAYNTGAGEDSGFYEGVLTTAHEVGHNLGAPHDGDDGADSCPWEDGYLMSYVADSYKDFLFSSCSSSAMCDIYNKQSAGCLKTVSNSGGYSLTSNLIGGDYSLDEQCQYHSGKSHAYADTSIPASQHCYTLQCQYVERPYLYTATYGVPAIEGTDCYPAADGLRCLDGKCQ